MTTLIPDKNQSGRCRCPNQLCMSYRNHRCGIPCKPGQVIHCGYCSHGHGLGDRVAATLRWMGIRKKCGGCGRRQKLLNHFGRAAMKYVSKIKTPF